MTIMKDENKMRIVYFSHGGGPLPLLGDASHQAMIEFMTRLPEQLPKPEAILLISAHWEEPVVTIMGSAHPPMFYDYYGFPEAAYQVNYPAKGHPELAGRIAALLKNAAIPSRIDEQRGYDHGLFIPLSLMFPQADIPAIQISLHQDLSPARHITLGAALRSLQNENLLVIGSGFSFHNMSAFFHHDPAVITPRNDAFQDWLIKTITSDIGQPEREARLIAWESAPHARYCHPREEHLLPLHVCAGLAGRAGKVIFDDKILGVRCAAFTW